MKGCKYYIFAILFSSTLVLGGSNLPAFGEVKPELIVPFHITEYTENKYGKIVNYYYSVIGIDKDKIFCNPEPGTIFKVGTTRVTCQSSVLSEGGMEGLWVFAKNIPPGETPTIQVGGSFFVTVKNFEKEDLSNIPKPEQAPAKIDAMIFDLISSDSNDLVEFAKSRGLEVNEDGLTRVTVELSNPSFVNNVEFKSLNLEIEEDSPDQKKFQLEIPVENIINMSSLDFVEKIEAPSFVTQEGVVRSEGAIQMGSVLINDHDITGNGVKVGVIDLAFDDDNEEISEKINRNLSKSFRHYLGTNDTIPLNTNNSEIYHGTAVAELIIDVAPDVDLTLMTAKTDIEFIEAVDYSIDNGLNIITSSMGFIGLPSDGTSAVTQAVTRAINEKNIPFVTSSGNYAQHHWEGKFKDDDKPNKWHEFQGGDEALSFYISQKKVDENYPLVISLFWSSDSDKTADFDLQLLDPDFKPIKITSNKNDSKDDLIERIFYTPKTNGTYHVGIYYNGEDTPDATLEIFQTTYKDDVPLEHVVEEGSTVVPKDAKGAIVVGAFDYGTNTVELFSSQGPTNNGIEIPTLVAPDGVTTTSMGYFDGTSAASPHVAGLVALLLDKKNNIIEPKTIKELLEKNANPKIFSNNNYPEYIIGHGSADAEFILNVKAGNKFTWITNLTHLWSDTRNQPGGITDEQFDAAIEYLIRKGIIKPPQTNWEDWRISNFGLFQINFQDDTKFLAAIDHLNSENITSMELFSEGQALGGKDSQIPRTGVSGVAEAGAGHNPSETPDKKPKSFLEDDNLSVDLLNQIILILENIPDDATSPPTESEGGNSVIPAWVKNNAGWWSEGLILDKDFAQGIEFLIKNKVIKVQGGKPNVNPDPTSEKSILLLQRWTEVFEQSNQKAEIYKEIGFNPPKTHSAEMLNTSEILEKIAKNDFQGAEDILDKMPLVFEDLEQQFTEFCKKQSLSKLVEVRDNIRKESKEYEIIQQVTREKVG